MAARICYIRLVVVQHDNDQVSSPSAFLMTAVYESQEIGTLFWLRHISHDKADTMYEIDIGGGRE